MTMKAISNGFKHCGVYPFDRQIVLKRVVLESHSTTTASVNLSQSKSTGKQEQNQADGGKEDPCFTVEQEERFRRHLEEGYDLPDQQYELWLQKTTTIPCQQNLCHSTRWTCIFQMFVLLNLF